MRRLALVLLVGCAALKPIVAASDDADDYRAFRVAKSWGARLSAAQRYLEKHPRGSFTDEVREAFEREEPRFFAKASDTREGVRDYLADLPRGPHAEQALALLVNFDVKVDDLATAKLLKAARSSESILAEAAEQRRRADDWISASIAALVSDAPWNKPIEAAPDLVAQLKPERATTWGGMGTRNDVRFAVAIPSPDGLQPRVVTASLIVDAQGGLVRSGAVEGADLFVRWAEMDALRPLDPARSEDRAAASARVRERLVGMLERRFPEASCAGGGDEADLIARRCGGRAVRVVMGGAAGDVDRLDFTLEK